MLLSLGGIFLTIGLVLYMAYLAWSLEDTYDTTLSDHEASRQFERRSILGYVAMITVLVGIFFFVR
jgi:hypothetical protein